MACVSWSFQTAIVKYHKLGAYKQQRLVSHCSEEWMFKVKTPEDVVSSVHRLLVHRVPGGAGSEPLGPLL
jgi:hypothetical protein